MPVTSRPRRLTLGLIAMLCIRTGGVLACSSSEEPQGQSAPQPRLMIVSQPRGIEGAADFVDIGFFLTRAVKDLNRFDVILYKPTDAAVSDAVKAGRLQAEDAAAHLSEADIHKIAEAIGAVYLVKVTAAKSRDGVGAAADMQVRLGGNRWSSIFTTTLAPFKSRSKRSELLDAIHAQVAALIPRISAAPPVPAATTERAAVGTDRPEPTTGPAQAATQPSGPSTADMLIDRFRREGDTANLIITLRKSVTERPRDPKLRRDLILAMMARGWAGAARDEAARALTLCPANAELHRLLGDGFLAMDQVQEAMKEYEEACRLEPDNPANRVALGDAYLAQSLFAEAETAYRTAQQADGGSSLPRYRMARLRAQSLKFAEASAELSEARKAAGATNDTAYAETFVAIMEIVAGAAQDVAGRLGVVRKEFVAGSRTREDAHTAALECRDRSKAMAALVSDHPAPQGYAAVQALYTQAAALLAQSSGGFASFLESRNDEEDREATLLRQEALRQLDDAAKRLKAVGGS